QIKEDLKHKSKTLPLIRVKQLLILSNFATLWLNGFSIIDASMQIAHQWHEGNGNWFARRVHALARHYQVFEQLPVEKHDSSSNNRSWLHNKSVQNCTREWLTTQSIGKVMPHNLQQSLNSIILPDLGMIPAKPLSICTARRWLIKLGWRRTVVRKGIYMGGHEHSDVVKYRNGIFLPAMEHFEKRMMKYEGPELECVKPPLSAGEKEIVAYFHDESSFHANEETRSLWLRDGEQPLRKKGRGCLIRISDFICEATGRLVVRDSSGEIVKDAWQVIYPGTNGNAWWDSAQLLAQVKAAIAIHNELHPDKQAVWVFDQSSNHAALPPDALRAFDMNKSDGGKQRKQRDMVIPMTNPIAEFRGQPQKMTTFTGEPKGLKTVLEEHGFDVRNLRAKCSPVCPFENNGCCMAWLLSQQDDFANQQSMLEQIIKDAGHECIFLPKFHCELNPIEMYWGWCKHRYREISKPNFSVAKRVALEVLNSCPIEVIRRFINHSWRFMSAYRLGLTGKAAAWAVRKQKQHRSVSQRAMLEIESVLN
ncbi:hypothetical protein WOLCODRAFT_82413, partial [Wolfiporia cocos MD-104 SS10]